MQSNNIKDIKQPYKNCLTNIWHNILPTNSFPQDIREFIVEGVVNQIVVAMLPSANEVLERVEEVSSELREFGTYVSPDSEMVRFIRGIRPVIQQIIGDINLRQMIQIVADDFYEILDKSEINNVEDLNGINALLTQRKIDQLYQLSKATEINISPYNTGYIIDADDIPNNNQNFNQNDENFVDNTKHKMWQKVESAINAELARVPEFRLGENLRRPSVGTGVNKQTEQDNQSKRTVNLFRRLCNPNKSIKKQQEQQQEEQKQEDSNYRTINPYDIANLDSIPFTQRYNRSKSQQISSNPHTANENKRRSVTFSR